MVKSKSKSCGERLCLEQVSSAARCEKSQVQSLKALGLGKIGRRVTVAKNDCICGLVRKVSHLVKVECCSKVEG